MRLSDFFDAFDFFDADIEQAHTRPFDAEQGTCHGGAHKRKVGKLARRSTDVGSQIEHDAVVPDCRPLAGDHGPLDARHRPQYQLGHSHQGAGVAGRDRDLCLTFLDCFQRKPHAGAAPTPHGLARLVLHSDDDVGMHDA